ncbi:MAG: N-acetylglucosamine-6-phosphate deacetylase [Nocardioidaceae bacterium]
MTSPSLAGSPAVVRGRVVTPDNVIEDGVVVAAHDGLSFVGPTQSWPASHPGGVLPDPMGTILPGLVDIHCHGGGGSAFTASSEARAAARHHHGRGTTSVVASLMTAPAAELAVQVETLAPLVQEGLIAGVHLEGPFLSPRRCGAQPPEFLLEPDQELVARLLDHAAGTVQVMTLAPELPGAADVARQLRAAGVVVALGHTDATYDVFKAQLEALEGTALVTHLANGMPALHHRAPGPVAAALEAVRSGLAVVELIADGVHLSDGFVAMVATVGAPNTVALVTDAMVAAGMPDGRYDLGAQRVEVRAGVARLAPVGESVEGAQTSIAGGTSHLLDVVARTVHGAGIPLLDAVRAASSTPAKVLGLDRHVGALRPGLAADLLVVDGGLGLLHVMRRGEWLS